MGAGTNQHWNMTVKHPAGAIIEYIEHDAGADKTRLELTAYQASTRGGMIGIRFGGNRVFL